jgi:hypothetical protein
VRRRGQGRKRKGEVKQRRRDDLKLAAHPRNSSRKEGKLLIGEAEVERDVRRGHVFKEVPDTAGADAV